MEESCQETKLISLGAQTQAKFSPWAVFCGGNVLTWSALAQGSLQGAPLTSMHWFNIGEYRSARLFWHCLFKYPKIAEYSFQIPLSLEFYVFLLLLLLIMMLTVKISGFVKRAEKHKAHFQIDICNRHQRGQRNFSHSFELCEMTCSKCQTFSRYSLVGFQTNCKVALTGQLPSSCMVRNHDQIKLEEAKLKTETVL